MTWLLIALSILAVCVGLVLLVGIGLLIHGIVTAPVRDDWD